MTPISRTLVVAVAALACAASAEQPLAGRLEGRLVQTQGGRLAAVSAPTNARRIAVYFGAGWCGPCRAFAPELRAAYPALKAGGVEVVFFSDDTGCRAMGDYILSSRMPWPAVRCEDRRRFPDLRRARGHALPGLLVYDASGALVASSWSRDGTSRPRRTLAELQAWAG